MADGTQHRIGRNRPPRVQITYDVEIGNAIQKVEIPFVVGVMADLSGSGDNVPADRAALKDKSRSFVEIDRDNFTDVMAKIAPSVKVAGYQSNGGDAISFQSLDDFNPASLVKRIDSLALLQRQRATLRDILTKLDSNDKLHRDLQQLVKDARLGGIADAADKRLKALAPPEGDGESG